MKALNRVAFVPQVLIEYEKQHGLNQNIKIFPGGICGSDSGSLGLDMQKERKISKEIHFEDSTLLQDICGPQGKNLKLIGKECAVECATRGNTVYISSGDPSDVDLVQNLLCQFAELLRCGYKLDSRDIDSGIRILSRDPTASLKKMYRKDTCVSTPRRTVVPKTLSQRDYLRSIRKHDLVFGIGPAGTGKTYLAVSLAISELMQRTVSRIVLTRPAVEAGERLGFLPGDLMEKVNPYLRPLYDALHDMVDFKKVQEMIETGIIEVAPLAFMRGRTLNDAFIILDEAQNTTPEQMKMFLTRMGFGAKAVVTGDVTQIDLPGGASSGLVQSAKILQDVKGVDIVHFDERDVIRHDLVAQIIKAYDKYQRKD
ncbi:MAG: PhoH family protein [Desulfovibrionales bacterium]